MRKENTFIARNTLFGVIVGLSFILAVFVFYRAGKPVGFNPQLGNVFLLLTVAGVFIGVRKYREECLEGYIDYPLALGACVYIVAVGSLLYGMFLYTLYGRSPELQEQYLATIELFLDEAYKGTPVLDTVKEMMRKFVSPLFIAFSETVSKCLSGFIFSLFIAGILRRQRPENLPAA
jgi:hypothetical protein